MFSSWNEYQVVFFFGNKLFNSIEIVLYVLHISIAKCTEARLETIQMKFSATLKTLRVVYKQQQHDQSVSIPKKLNWNDTHTHIWGAKERVKVCKPNYSICSICSSLFPSWHIGTGEPMESVAFDVHLILLCPGDCSHFAKVRVRVRLEREHQALQ